MSLELVIVFFLILLMLKATLFKGVSTATIVGFTIILVFLIVVVKGQESMEHFFDSDLVYLQNLAIPVTLRDKDKENNDSCGGNSDGGGSRVTPTVSPSPTAVSTTREADASTTTQKEEADIGLQETLTEDTDQLTKNLKLDANALTFYYSVFSPISYKVTDTAWQSVVGGAGPLVLTEPPSKFVTDKNLAKGMPLGSNKIKGPETSALGLRGEADFSIHIMLQFKPLRRSDNAIEVFSLYGGDPKSSSPVGVTMVITDINQSSVVQSAKIMIRLSNNTDDFVCMINQQSQIPLDPNDVFVFTVVKSTSQMSVYMSKLTDQTVVKAVVSNNIEPCHQFVNLPMAINANGNVDGTVMVFAGHNKALDQDQVYSVHAYFFTMHKKMNDVEYIDALAQLRELEKKYKAITQCPLDKEGCAVCDDIKDWANMSQLMLAPPKCHEKVSEFCKTNTSDFCACWDETKPTYNLPTCKALRGAFSGKSMIDIDGLSEEDLKKIKARYDVCHNSSPATSPAASPAASPAPAQPPSCPAVEPPPASPALPQLWPTTTPPAPQPPPPPPPQPLPLPPFQAQPSSPPMPLQPKAKCKKKKGQDTDTSFFGWIKHLFSVDDDDF